jgi:hypothetical protein
MTKGQRLRLIATKALIALASRILGCLAVDSVVPPTMPNHRKAPIGRAEMFKRCSEIPHKFIRRNRLRTWGWHYLDLTKTPAPITNGDQCSYTLGNEYAALFPVSDAGKSHKYVGGIDIASK